MKYDIHYRFCLLTSALLCLASCAEDNLFDDGACGLVAMQLHTSSVATRTSLLDDGTTVVWDESDELAVYDYEASKHRFVAAHIDASTARFVGNITKKKSEFLALYPYALGADHLSADGDVLATLPREQTAAVNTFAPHSNIAIAKGTRNVDGSPSVITFYNVCQLLKFTIPAYASGKISQIQLTSRTSLVGTLGIHFQGDMPEASITADGLESVIINPPSGCTTFDAGTYYIATAPVELQGFTMHFTCGDTSYSLASNSTFGGNAGKVYSLGSIDLVNTPYVITQHKYADGMLQGTALTVYNPPIEGAEWTAVIKNEHNIVVRTMQGVGPLSSSEYDEQWPYLHRGDYTLEYSFSTSNGKTITNNQTFYFNETPKFSVGMSAYTSYSYYKGDGVERDINTANKLDNVTIYEPTITINGVSPRLLANPHYTFTVTNDFGGVLSGTGTGVHTYHNYTVGSYASYTLTGTVTFDGVSRTRQKKVHITGLPYKTTPPTQADWSGTAAQWTDAYARLHKNQTITKSFYCPENINVNVGHTVRVRRHTENTTYQLLCSGVTLKSVQPKTGLFGCQTEVSDNGVYEGTLYVGNATVSCYNSFGQDNIPPLEGTNAQVKQILVQYR